MVSCFQKNAKNREDVTMKRNYVLLFVMVDGWYLIVGSLVRSFH